MTGDERPPQGDSERLASVISALRAGADPHTAWQAWAGHDEHAANPLERSDALGLSLAAADNLARHTGAPLADILEGVARAQRDQEDAAQRRDAALAGPRASARTLMWLPAVGVALGALIEPGTVRLLFTTVLGGVLLVLSALLVWAAHRWMRALVTRAEQAGAPW